MLAVLAPVCLSVFRRSYSSYGKAFFDYCRSLRWSVGRLNPAARSRRPPPACVDCEAFNLGLHLGDHALVEWLMHAVCAAVRNNRVLVENPAVCDGLSPLGFVRAAGVRLVSLPLPLSFLLPNAWDM